MTDFDTDDLTLREHLRDVAPPAEFARERLGARIAASLHHPQVQQERTPTRHTTTRRMLQVAAGIMLFVSGWGAARLSAPVQRPIPTLSAAAIPALVTPDRVSWSIQQTGTSYVASVAMLAEMRDRLTASQREQAREIAVSVLSGAVLELLAAGNQQVPSELLTAILRHGVPAAGGSSTTIRTP